MSVFSVHSWKTLDNLSQSLLVDHLDKYDTHLDNTKLDENNASTYFDGGIKPGLKEIHGILNENDGMVEDKFDDQNERMKNLLQRNKDEMNGDAEKQDLMEKVTDGTNKVIEFDDDYDEGLGDLDAIFDDFDEVYEATLNGSNGCDEDGQDLTDDTGSDKASSETDSVLGSPFSPSESNCDNVISPFSSELYQSKYRYVDDNEAVEKALNELKNIDLSNEMFISENLHGLKSEIVCNRSDVLASNCDQTSSGISGISGKAIKTCLKIDTNENTVTREKHGAARARFLSVPTKSSVDSQISGKLSPTTKAKSVHFAIFPYVIEIPRVADIEQEYMEEDREHLNGKTFFLFVFMIKVFVILMPGLYSISFAEPCLGLQRQGCEFESV